MCRRFFDCVPLAVQVHPLGLLAMFGWALMGLSLLVPTFMGDPKPWPDLFWPALLSGTPDEKLGMLTLGLGMVTSGLAFIAGQVCLPRLWAEKLRWGALWIALFVNLYVTGSLVLKGLRDPDQIAPYWPMSLGAWLISLSLFALSIRAAARHGYGATYRGPDRRVPRDDN